MCHPSLQVIYWFAHCLLLVTHVTISLQNGQIESLLKPGQRMWACQTDTSFSGHRGLSTWTCLPAYTPVLSWSYYLASHARPIMIWQACYIQHCLRMQEACSEWPTTPQGPQAFICFPPKLPMIYWQHISPGSFGLCPLPGLHILQIICRCGFVLSGSLSC